jgi:type II secretory pathway pseudopilin PulG
MGSTRVRPPRGEFLLMLLVAVAIVGILAGLLAPAISTRLDEAQLAQERANLEAFRGDVEATFDSTDYTGSNMSSVPQSGLPAGTTFTTLDQAPTMGSRIYDPSIAVDPAGWVTKLARRRGVASFSSGDSYTALSQSQYGALAFNAYRTQRCLLAGPAGEAGQQRYLLVSLMVPATRVLVFPQGDPAALFESLWDQNWEASGAQAPSAWQPLLSAADYGLWNGTGSNGRTNASRLIVARIVQPKYGVTLVNNSPTDTAWMDVGPAVDAVVAAPASGSHVIQSVSGFGTGVLAGREIVVRRGVALDSAFEVQRFFLYSNVTVTIQ